MRQQLIEALTYPRLLVEKLIEERDCPHDSLFHATSDRCRQCDKDKPEYTINASLRYGIKLVETLHSELLHDETICSCEPCSWVRDAQRLTEEFEQHLEPNPYRPAQQT